MKNQEIVIVDDNETDTFLLNHILKLFVPQEKIKSYLDSKQALEYLQNCLEENSFPEKIFLDINMPGLTGFDLLEAINKFPEALTKNTKVVMVTSSEDPKDIGRSKEFPKVVKYLVKPVTPHDYEELEKL